MNVSLKVYIFTILLFGGIKSYAQISQSSENKTVNKPADTKNLVVLPLFQIVTNPIQIPYLPKAWYGFPEEPLVWGVTIIKRARMNFRTIPLN